MKTPPVEIPDRYKAKTNRKCKSCAACKNNPGLRTRYYKAWFEREPGEETLEMIGRELGLSNQAVYRHAHNHMKQRVSRVKATTKANQEVADLKAQAMKDLEISFDHNTVLPKELHEEILETIMVEGLAQMRVAGLKPTINQMIAAAKITGDNRAKKRGQDTEIIKMMYRSASGFNASKT